MKDDHDCGLPSEALLEGLNDHRDTERSALMAKRSCRLGSNRGCSLLGQRYEKGDGVGLDIAEARRWFESACKDCQEWSCGHLKEMERKPTESRGASGPG